jgi:hypothetical protein
LNTVGRFFKSGASIVNLAADHIMFPNQPTDQLAAWPPCFETLAIVHQPYIPAPIKAGTTVHSFSRNRIATPNPTSNEITLGTTEIPMDWHILDATGRQMLSLHFDANSLISIPVSTLAPGLYFGESTTQTASGRVHWQTQFVKMD